MFQYKTLNDIPIGSVLELQSFEKTSTAVGDTIIVRYIDTEKGARRVKGQLLMPQRLAVEAMEKIPCVMHYGGKKASSKPNSRDYHDVNFITPDYFTDSSSEDELNTSDNQVADKKNDCELCGDKTDLCPGYCDLCLEHQPINGSQCRCIARGFARRNV